MTKSAQRIYVIETKQPGEGVPPVRRLVRATNAPQAWRYAAASTITVEVASQDDLIDLIAAGVKVEESARQAGGEPEA